MSGKTFLLTLAGSLANAVAGGVSAEIIKQKHTSEIKNNYEVQF